MLYLIKIEATASSWNVFEKVGNKRILLWTLLAFMTSGCFKKSILIGKNCCWGNFLIFFFELEFPTWLFSGIIDGPRCPILTYTSQGKVLQLFIINFHLAKFWFLKEQKKAKLLPVGVGQRTHREILTRHESVTNFWILQPPLWSYSEGESCKTSDHVRLPSTAANSFTTCLLPKIKSCLGTVIVSDVRLACSVLWLSWKPQLRSWGQILPTWEVTETSFGFTVI